jgi:hypothetical protein
VVGDDVFARVDAGDDGGKRNPPVRRPTRDLAYLGKLSPSEVGYNEARSDTCKRISPTVPLPQASCSSG